MRTWGALLAAAIIIETIAIERSRPGKDAGTLSHTTRTLFRTDTPIGRAAFLLTLGGGSAWTAAHILNQSGNA